MPSSQVAAAGGTVVDPIVITQVLSSGTEFNSAVVGLGAAVGDSFVAYCPPLTGMGGVYGTDTYTGGWWS